MSLIPAIIAFIGVLISVIASILASIRQSRLEVRKLQSEYVHLYSEKLFSLRTTIYPQIYKPLVIIIQKINVNEPISADEIEHLAKALFEWNTEHALFLGARPEQIMHKLYIELNKMTLEERETLVQDKEALYTFKQKLLNFIIALKNDLGIYALISPSAITSFQDPKSIKDVTTLSGA